MKNFCCSQCGDIKRRIAMALRRYVVEKMPSKKYQEYFGCSQGFMRAFVRAQFVDGEDWQGFGNRWKIGHILALEYFDMKNERDRKLCWNWTNLRVVRAGEERRILSAEEALHMLSDRVEIFPENTCVGELIVKAYELQGRNLADSRTNFVELRNQYDSGEWTEARQEQGR